MTYFLGVSKHFLFGIGLEGCSVHGLAKKVLLNDFLKLGLQLLNFMSTDVVSGRLVGSLLH